MAGSDRTPSVDVANLVAAIERAAADLALGEEPARFVAALEAGVRPPDPPAREASRD